MDGKQKAKVYCLGKMGKKCGVIKRKDAELHETTLGHQVEWTPQSYFETIEKIAQDEGRLEF